MTHAVFGHPQASLFTPRMATSRRASSWDTSGANQDFIQLQPGETVALLEEEGPGCVTHIYCAMVLPDLTDYRDAILRCYWDGSGVPSVQVPLGDFFGVVHGRVREYRSAMTAVNAGVGSSHGLNAYFPMPFSSGARITLENRGTETLGGVLGAFWYHIEYETYQTGIPQETYRFHATYRQERTTTPATQPENVTLHGATNLDGAENYVALDASGTGRMVGLVLGVDNRQGSIWYGEGDDMVFIDGEEWPPSIHGTGSEEIFGGGACPSKEYAGPYSGFHLVESSEYEGLVAMYRWYLNDPIHFQESLRWTLEHGHANNFANDYTSVAYWYQAPLGRLDDLPSRDAMRPRLDGGYDEARDALFSVAREARQGLEEGEPLLTFLKACQAGNAFYRGDWASAIDEIKRFRSALGDL